MTSNRTKRLRALEARIKPQKCPHCNDYPVRITRRDADTEEIHTENMPASGCPECGQMPVSELNIVFEQEASV